MREVAFVACLLASGCDGCREPTAGVAPASSPDAVDAVDAVDAARSCSRRAAEKLGIPFLKICPQDLPVAVDFEPFWIAAAPIGCSAGEHETLRCPSVVALSQPAGSESRPPWPIASRLAAVVDADVAYRVCTMRFAGRLPTREERSRASAAAGLATVVVAASGSPTHFELRPLAEWVMEKPCDDPTLLDPACGVGTYPLEGSSEIPWSSLASCDAAPLEAKGIATVGIGESCPTDGWTWGAEARLLPCAVRSAVGPGARPSVSAFSLACRAPRATRVPAVGGGAVAAARCVVPESSLPRE